METEFFSGGGEIFLLGDAKKIVRCGQIEEMWEMNQLPCKNDGEKKQKKQTFQLVETMLALKIASVF